MSRRIKLTQFQVLELCARVRQRFAILHPETTLNLNTNPANYRPLAAAINNLFGEERVSETWLRDLIIYAPEVAQGKVVSGYQLEALNKFIDSDQEGEVRIRQHAQRLRGKYRFVWRGTRLEREIIDGYITFFIEFTDAEIRFYEKESGAVYFKHHHHFLNGVDYIALMDQHHSELIFLTFQRGLAYGTDLNVIPGLFLASDTAYLPCAGPVLLVKDGIDYDQKHIDRFFSNYDFSSIKSQSITEVSGYGRTAMSPEVFLHEERRRGLEGKWVVLLYDPNAAGFELSHYTLARDHHVYESRACRYVDGSARLSGDRNLIIHICQGDRETTFTGTVGSFVKTGNVKRFLASLSATGASRASFGYGLFVRADTVAEPLAIGNYPIEQLLAAGFERSVLEPMMATPFQQVPELYNL